MELEKNMGTADRIIRPTFGGGHNCGLCQRENKWQNHHWSFDAFRYIFSDQRRWMVSGLCCGWRRYLPDNH